MTKIKLFLFCCYFLLAQSGIYSQTARQIKAANGYTVGFLQYLPSDYGSQGHPLIIFLHGIGERGPSTTFNTDATTVSSVAANEIPKLVSSGASLQFTVNCERFSFVVLAPQLSGSYGSWQNWYVDEMLRYAKANLKVDTNRIYLTGLSLGGGGVWKYASASLANASQFAAIAPVCGTCEWTDLCNIAKAGTPVWAFHAQDDLTVGVGCTNSAVAALQACGLVAAKTIYPNGGHWIWSRSYDTTNAWGTPNLYQWMLAQKRTGAAKPPPPAAGLVAHAGQDVAVTGSTATLDAGLSSGYAGDWAISWRVVEQPAGSSWDIFPGYNKIGVKKTLQNLSPGRWVLEVAVVDKLGNKATDQVVVAVR